MWILFKSSALLLRISGKSCPIEKVYGHCLFFHCTTLCKDLCRTSALAGIQNNNLLQHWNIAEFFRQLFQGCKNAVIADEEIINLPAGGNFPDLQVVIPVYRCQVISMRAKIQITDFVRMSCLRPDLPSGRYLPEFYCFVWTSGGCKPAVRAECDWDHPA